MCNCRYYDITRDSSARARVCVCGGGGGGGGGSRGVVTDVDEDDN